MKLPLTLDLSSVPVQELQDRGRVKFTDSEPVIARDPKTGSRILFCCGNVQNRVVVIDNEVQIRKMGTWYQWYARPGEEFGVDSIREQDWPISPKKYTLEDLQEEYDADWRAFMEPDQDLDHEPESTTETGTDSHGSVMNSFTDHQKALLADLVQGWAENRAIDEEPFSWVDLQKHSYLSRAFLRECATYKVHVTRALGTFIISGDLKTLKDVDRWIETLLKLKGPDSTVVTMHQWMSRGAPTGSTRQTAETSPPPPPQNKEENL